MAKPTVFSRVTLPEKTSMPGNSTPEIRTKEGVFGGTATRPIARPLKISSQWGSDRLRCITIRIQPISP